MKRIIYSAIILLLLVLTACNSNQGNESTTAVSSGNVTTNNGTDSSNTADTGNDVTTEDPANENEAPAPAENGIGDGLAALFSSEGELSPQATLALGILSLEGGEQAVGMTQAETMLPLWRAYNSLTTSGTAAQAELDAVVRQIEGQLTADQLAEIGATDLSMESMQALLESGALTLGRGFGDRAGREGAAGGGVPGGGFPGGPAGGGPGQGGGFPGGGPGGFANVDPDAQATRQAQFTGGAGVEDRILTNAVVNLLAAKTGEEIRNDRGFFQDVTTAVAEATGLDLEQLNEELAAGKSPAEIVAQTGGDLDALRATLKEILADTPIAENFNLDEWIEAYLTGDSLEDGP